MANRQWLETLTDEEFAKWHTEVECRSCVHNPEKGFCNNLTDITSFERDRCVNGKVQWLKKEKVQ